MTRRFSDDHDRDITTTVERPGAGFRVDEAQLAAVSFLARYSGRTLEATAMICAATSNGHPTRRRRAEGNAWARWQFRSAAGQGSPVVLKERTYRPVDADTIAASDAHNTVTLAYQLDGDTLTIDVVDVAGDQSSAPLPLIVAPYQTAPFTRA